MPGQARQDTERIHAAFWHTYIFTAFKLLERIANGEMIAHPILEADHKKVHVISKTKAGYNTHSIQFSGVTIACSRTT